ncbi:ATP-binding protein [Roseateles sp.]|uniref:ATP-binding protein n=1 Tax=Roseateles sp. TaxID=1971397 RepID=UPI003D145CB7
MKVKANYSVEKVPSHMRGNPFIEALPTWREEHEIVRLIANVPPANFAITPDMPQTERRSMLKTLDSIYLPNEAAAGLAGAMDELIRNAYLTRNPMNVESVAEMYDDKSLIHQQGAHDSPIAGMMLLEGCSGMGKTRLVRVLLARYPRSIEHHEYKGKKLHTTQLVWISVEAPVGGSLRSLLLSLLDEIDEAANLVGTAQSYADDHRNSNIPKLLKAVGRAAKTHNLGMIHVDDLQRITELRSKRNGVFHFIVQLANVVKCPVIFTGTPEGAAGFEDSFEAIRRMNSDGAFVIPRTQKFASKFAEVLFKYQWTPVPIQPDPKLIAYMVYLSASVTHVMILLHKEAHRIAIRAGDPSLKKEHYTSAYRSRLRRLYKGLKVLRKQQPNSEKAYEDIMMELRKDGFAKDY